MMMKLSRGAIDKLPPPSDGRREYIVWDPDLPCFGVRVRAMSKVWRIQYRVGRQQRSESLGDVRKVGLESARGHCRRAGRQICG
jgi:hypothetical protein